MEESWELLPYSTGDSHDNLLQNFGCEWEGWMGLGVDWEPLAGHYGINIDSSIKDLNITLTADQATTWDEGKTDFHEAFPVR